MVFPRARPDVLCSRSAESELGSNLEQLLERSKHRLQRHGGAVQGSVQGKDQGKVQGPVQGKDQHQKKKQGRTGGNGFQTRTRGIFSSFCQVSTNIILLGLLLFVT